MSGREALVVLILMAAEVATRTLQAESMRSRIARLEEGLAEARRGIRVLRGQLEELEGKVRKNSEEFGNPEERGWKSGKR